MYLFNGVLFLFICGSQSEADSAAKAFVDYKLVPYILSQPPASLLYARYPSGAVVSEGNLLPVLAVTAAPAVSWGAKNGVYYVVLMFDPDVPSRKNPILRSLLHWMVINAQNNDVSVADIIAFYLLPTPPPGSNKHRYVILVYSQPAKMSVTDFAQYALVIGRLKFSPDEFARQFNLGVPVAGNFFQAEITNLTLY